MAMFVVTGLNASIKSAGCKTATNSISPIKAAMLRILIKIER